MKAFCFFVLLLAVANSYYIDDSERPPLADSLHDEEDPILWEDNFEGGDKFEGDIVLTEEQEREILNATIFNGTERNGLRNTRSRWPGAVVPYVFSSVFTQTEKNTILAALADYAAYTCIKVVERTNEPGYVEFVKQGGCWSYVGALGRKQQISLVPGCLRSRGTIIHEVMHALGFFHEQSRTDRDKYVTINFDNIYESRKSNFKSYSSSRISGFGQSYDYGSVMHYPAYAFSKNGKKTIVPKDASAKIGQRRGLSQIDIAKINAMYNCGTIATIKTTTTKAPCVNNYGGPDWRCTYWKILGYCTHSFVSFMNNNCAKACSGCSS